MMMMTTTFIDDKSIQDLTSKEFSVTKKVIGNSPKLDWAGTHSAKMLYFCTNTSIEICVPTENLQFISLNISSITKSHWRRWANDGK